MSRIYKILAPPAWADGERAGVIALEGADARDGFVHLSAGPQVAGSLARYFAEADGVALVAFEAAAFGAALRWEPSRDGDLYPHLYAPLRADAAVGAWLLTRGDDGAFELPAEIA